MKRLFPLLILGFLFPDFYAQNHVDALRYSQLFPGGTARSVALGGAFGALGGDIYSASANPAGLGFYRRSEMTFTPEIYTGYTESQYKGNIENDYKTNFNLNNFGYVSSFKLNSDGFVGGSFGFGYNKLNNFSNRIRIIGNNDQNSIADYFAESANYGEGNGPVGLDQLLPYSEGLFYDGYIMDRSQSGYYSVNPIIRDSNDYVNVDQNNEIERKGKMNEWFFSTGINYNHKIYFGASLSIIPIKYEEKSSFRERGVIDGQSYFDFRETLKTTGTGYSGKVGIIYKPIHILRIGLSYHFPTIYELKDVSYADLQSNLSPTAGVFVPVDEFGDELTQNEFDYYIKTPGKAIGSLALMIGNKFIISSDIEYINYTGMKLGSETEGGYDFRTENGDIDRIYRKNINIKTGAEARISKLYLRGGFGYYGSPYSSKELNRDAYQLSYSGGIGVRGKHNFLDLTVFYKTTDENLILYPGSEGSHNVANLKMESFKFMATIGFKF